MNNKELYEDYLKSEQHPWLSHVEEVYDKYVKVWNNTRIERGEAVLDSYLYPHCDYDRLGEDDVVFKGEETWQYGGYEEHTVYIPLKYFLCEDGSLLREFELERSGRKNAILTKQKNEELERKRKQYEKLRQELERELLEITDDGDF